MNREQLDLSILNEISQTIGSSLELHEVFNSVMAVLGDRLNTRRGTLVLVEGDEMKIVAAHGLTEEEKQRGRYTLGEGITGRVANTGQPIVVPDIRTDPLFLDRTGARRAETGPVSFICVPLKYGNATIGVLSVDKDYAYAEMLNSDRSLLMIVAAFIAQAVKLNEMVQLERAQLMQENTLLREELRTKYRFDNIIGTSSPMRQIFETVALVAPSRASVLITGETGTGKELVARAIHYNSPRRDMPFVSVSCAALTDSLLESELFGHVRGAFTGAVDDKKGRFELADGGTLFLDEIGDTSEALQTKLLRVLQERQFERVGGSKTISVDVRLITATNRDLEQAIAGGRSRETDLPDRQTGPRGTFREDLFYRLNVVHLHLPPLRERRDDIPLLIRHFLEKYSRENNKEITGVAPDALNALIRYQWPGNVRELESCIEMAVVMCTVDRLTADLLPARLRPAARVPLQLGTQKAVEQAVTSLCWDDVPSEGMYQELIPLVERGLIERALAESEGIRLKAAQLLGINRNTLHKKMAELHIEAEK